MLPGPVRELVAQALAEDLRSGDITSRLTLRPEWEARAVIRSRTAGVFAGAELISAVYEELAEDMVLVDLARGDGEPIRRNQTIAEVAGPAHVILAGERVLLNFLQRLSGIATLTARYVAATKGTEVRITDTRKTTPGLRALEKLAVRCGGGLNHRFGLDDCVMIKDNHIELHALHCGLTRAQAIAKCVEAARAGAGHTMHVVTEVESEEEALVAAEAGTDVLLLDNFHPDALRQCVRSVRKVAPRIVLEASGGVTLRSVAKIAKTGVDVISVGALTHSPPSLDIGMDIL